uniref:Uncharacterized protein n=1 Tax=Ditylenchus dipsaci TaxID=166011 RepID=A0A915EN46_9BILA
MTSPSQKAYNPIIVAYRRILAAFHLMPTPAATFNLLARFTSLLPVPTFCFLRSFHLLNLILLSTLPTENEEGVELGEDTIRPEKEMVESPRM